MLAELGFVAVVGATLSEKYKSPFGIVGIDIIFYGGGVWKQARRLAQVDFISCLTLETRILAQFFFLFLTVEGTTHVSI